MDYTYAQVERSLARMFHLPIGSLRGRVKHFQKLGIVRFNPGRGKKIPYTLADAFRWALALEFAEFGIDPNIIATIMSCLEWKTIDGVILDDEYLVIYPAIISNPPTDPNGLPFFWRKDRAALVEFLGRDVVPDDVEPNTYDRRFGVIHTGALLRKLKAALDDSDDREAPA